MLLSIKTKLKLTTNQTTLMAKHARIARFIYNWGLATWQDLYRDGLKPNKYLLKKFFNNHVKPEYIWIKETGICQKITQYAFDQLGNAFDRCFKSQGKYPRFKRKGHNDSFTIDAGGKPIAVGGTSVKLPTIGWVKMFEGLPHTTTTKLTISRAADDWYIAFAYEQPTQITDKAIDVVGVDLGVKVLATLSTGWYRCRVSLDRSAAGVCESAWQRQLLGDPGRCAIHREPGILSQGMQRACLHECD